MKETQYNNFTFLTAEQCDGSDKLDIFKKRGNRAAITDFAILLGGDVSENDYINSENPLESRAGYYWTKTEYKTKYISGNIQIVSYFNSNDNDWTGIPIRRIGARPALPFSSISTIPTNGESGKRAKDGILEVEFGYYPQKAVSKDMQLELKLEFISGRLSETGKEYTTDSRYIGDLSEKFKPKIHKEYQYKGKKYVRVEANIFYPFQLLSNGEKYKDRDVVWVEVSPVKWLVDEKEKIMLTEKIIFAGVQFEDREVLDARGGYHTKDFDKINIKRFMDQYFSKDLLQSIEKTKLKEIEKLMKAYKEKEVEEIEKTTVRKSRLKKLNPDDSEPSERTNMTDTEIIHNWIESGESVLLRGPSGIGKTERIKSLYPDLTYIKLTNNMFPEKVVGSVNLQTGQSIPPDFAKNIIMEAATEEERKLIKESIQNIYDIADTVYERSKESGKKAVILLDELLNVKPAVQSLVYTLVLNRIVEIGKGLKLPDNVVVVATGNQKKYSIVAEEVAEPLEKRFDHILDMEPKVGEWITEYAIPHKVHPSVIGYILTKYNNSGKSENIEDIDYFYEEPEVGEEHLDKNGCRGRTNDPRGWASISNTLYNFENNLKAGKYKGKNVEDIIQRSIESKLRMEWASEFYDFYNLPTLSPEEVEKGIGKGYAEADLPRDINERFAYMTALITADETQVEACREFIKKYCDSEYLSVYDIYWAGNDERKMEQISELELQEMQLSLNIVNESKQYAEEGLKAYTDIGKMYSSYLAKENTKEKSKDCERN